MMYGKWQGCVRTSATRAKKERNDRQRQKPQSRRFYLYIVHPFVMRRTHALAHSRREANAATQEQHHPRAFAPLMRA